MPRGFFGAEEKPRRSIFGRLFGKKPKEFPHARRPRAERAPILLGRATFPTGRRTSEPIPFGKELYGAFLAGTDTHVTSSWLSWVRYDRDRQEMETHFLDGAAVTLEAVTEEVALSFYDAPSKGGWWWDNVLGPNYVKGQPGTALMRWH
jgi:hypothetical protein